MPLISTGTHCLVTHIYSLGLCDLAFDFNLSQVIQAPTHNKGNILDIVLTSFPEIISNINVTPHSFLNTDHLAVMFQVSFIPDISSSLHAKQIYDFSKADWAGLVDHLLDVDFDPLFSEDNIHYIWLALSSPPYISMFLLLKFAQLLITSAGLEAHLIIS